MRTVVVAAVLMAGLVGCGGDSAQRAAPSDHQATLAAIESASWRRYGDYADVDVEIEETEPQLLAEMIDHHQDAIDGSNRFLDLSNANKSADDELANDGAADGEVVELAARIVRVQIDQVSMMAGWQAAWGTGDEVGHWPPMFVDVKAGAGDEAEYLETMIEHHHHGILMYRTWVNSDAIIHDEFGRLLSEIAKGQTGEIAAMCQMLGRRDVSLPAECELL